ncbi:hypothetical protein E1265_28205 [Streptomyces sp. 8K308]|uniref:hypothetical protein n=1 Tax=Streptomyces sp. 8K308 TaxID=2530388 RepID=UPI00104BE0EF|nr:hypothetical protein [Streptomyces sp. 8K308]TDC13310.1 hypothetical protein E1265_28205 [Streptomyces sp. 8K308]
MVNTADERPVMPPVRLPSEAELAREALAAPLLSRAARLARWAAPEVPVGAGGELPAERLRSAVAVLGLEADEEGELLAAEAWNFAVDSGLVVVLEDPEAAEGGAGDEDGGEVVAGTAAPGPELAQLTEGRPADVLEIWAEGLDAVLAEVATPSFEELLGELPGGPGEDGGASIDPSTVDLDALDWDPEEEADFLDAALGSLYLFALTDDSGQAASMVPLPMVAAASVIPEDMDELSEAVMDELSAAVLKLDEQFSALVSTGLLEYEPVDESVLAEAEGEAVESDDVEVDDTEDLTRYGRARLTTLGLHAVRRRMIEAGLTAPLVGELADQEAAALLAALPYRPETAAHDEAELWLAAREPLSAARELLAAARGGDPAGPGRRLGCQLVLAMLDGRAEPALREVLADPELGGLARVWLAEHGVVDVPPPAEDMVFWLTIDTLAAQLGGAEIVENAPELRELVTDLADQHSGFFDRAWRTDHPATADVLEAVGRLHPDKQLAKQARKAAFKSRSRD